MCVHKCACMVVKQKTASFPDSSSVLTHRIVQAMIVYLRVSLIPRPLHSGFGTRLLLIHMLTSGSASYPTNLHSPSTTNLTRLKLDGVVG